MNEGKRRLGKAGSGGFPQTKANGNERTKRSLFIRRTHIHSFDPSLLGTPGSLRSSFGHLRMSTLPATGVSPQ